MAAADEGGFCCNLISHRRHHCFFSSHRPPLPQSAVPPRPPLRKRITNDLALPPSSTSLFCTAIPPPAPIAKSSSISNSLEDERKALRLSQLWEEFFSDPSQWCDNRSHKSNFRFPDFKHKTAKKALWIDDVCNPPWVNARLVAMAQCQGQGKHGFLTPKNSGRVFKMDKLWQDFFLNPSHWRDNRIFKKSPNYPDFEHKSTHEGLWVEHLLNPSWVKVKIGTLAFSRVQPGGGSRLSSRVLNFDVSKLCQEGRLEEALHVLELMVYRNFKIAIKTYVGLLKVCTRSKALVEGKRVHSLIVQNGLCSDIFLGNTLVNMYAKCGSVLDANKVFYAMPKHNVFSWTAIISAYADHGQGEVAIHLFQKMQHTGIAPDKVVYAVALKACARIAALEKGKQLHLDIIKCGFESDVVIGNTLVDMYAKCGCLEHACQTFNKMIERDVISWSAMIAGYAQNGLGKEAIILYEQMKQEGVQPNNFTYVILLKACVSIAALEKGKELHSDIIQSGCESDVIVANTLVDMYAKCGCLEHARQVFNNMNERDVVSWNSMIAAYVKCGCIEDACEVFNNMNERDLVSWNTMIAGYAQHGLGKEALVLYEQMKQEGVQPDNFTYGTLLKACSCITALEKGKQLHIQILKSGSQMDVVVGSALVDMYGKCGSIERARQVFDNMPELDVVSWNAMIAGYAQQGFGQEVLTLLEQMQMEGTKPTAVTYVSVLSACSHCGLVDKGNLIFDSMWKDHGIRPTMDHYACMVDLLGRAGRLSDAEDFINKMPIQPDVVVWRTLLGAAKNHGHVEIGRRTFDCIVKLEPEDAAAYVLLSNLYAATGRNDEAAKVKMKMKDAGVKSV